ncbi:MAG: carboxypeptidase-like regulatory domain-containing protein [Planctomycetota bacterium]|nr:carboxypeptidase-like regulatory domain-containing protein [Planctomycetota bacterium]
MATSFSGCSTGSTPNYGELGLVKISGRITVDGAPLANTRVQFVSPEDGSFSSGATDTNGRYSLMFDSETAGIIPGKKRVVFLSGRGTSEESSDEDPDQGNAGASSQAGNVIVPKCYGRSSKVEVEVTQSDSGFDIDLRSDCSTISR